MKRLFLAAIVSVMAIGMQAQTVTFKTGYKPGTVYTETLDQVMSNKITYPGMEPMDQSIEMTMLRTIKTGKAANGEMPVTMTISIPKSNQPTGIPEGTTLHGKAKPGAAPVFESIDAPGMQEDMKKMIMDLLQSNLAQSFIPEKTVKAGESFTVETPMSFPAGPITLEMKITSTYKLKKVESRKAYFDMTQVYALVNAQEGMSGSGTGSGEIIYDMDAEFPVGQNTTSNMKMTMSMQGTTINLDTNTTVKQTATVATNK